MPDAPGDAVPAAAPVRTVRRTPADRRAAILTGSVPRTLAGLALPTIAVLLAQTAVGIAETAYVGLLGTAPLAGVALVFPVFMLMVTMSNGGLGSGVASAVARATGAGRHADADALVLHAVALGAVAGMAFSVALIGWGPVLYAAMGGRGASLRAASLYSDLLFAGAVPAWIVNLIAAALRGSGDVRTPARVSLIGAAVMIPCSPALIFGVGPIPRLGVAGAGLAFTLYYAGALVVLLRVVAARRCGVRLRRMRPRRDLFVAILRVGLPTALNTVQTNLIVVVVTGIVGGGFGVDAIAGYGIASRLDYVLVPILFGLSSAVLTMTGIAVGAGDLPRARRVAWIGAAVGAGFAELVGLLVAVAPMLWIGIYTAHPAVAAPARTYLAIVAPCYGFMAAGFVFAFAAQGAGHAFWPTVAYTLRTIVAVGAGLAAVRGGAGLPGLCTAVGASYVVFALVGGVGMTSRRNRHGR